MLRALTKAKIAKMPNDKVVDQLYGLADALVCDTPDYRAGCLALPPGLRLLYVTLRMEEEVMNGGFHQFFWNRSGETADLTLTAFRKLGDPARAALLARAIRTFQTDKAGQAAMADKSSKEAFIHSEEISHFDPLDDKFYALKTDLRKTVLHYVRAHPDEFVCAPKRGKRSH